MKIYGWESELNFGKYQGQKLGSVYEKEPSYIYWCFQKIEWFCLSDEAFGKLSIISDFKQNFGNFALFGDKVYEDYVHQNQKHYDHLEKIHLEKHEKIENNDDNAFDDRYFEHNYLTQKQERGNWLRDASGTSDSETMNDVYWNLE